MKEEFYQKQMLEVEKQKAKVEEDKVKALLDIRDSLQVFASIGMNILAANPNVTVRNYQASVDTVKEARDASEKRWANEHDASRSN